MKRTTKMKLFRGISLMLCIIMMMQLTQLFVFAVGEDLPAAETNGEATPIENTLSENLFELGEGELPYAQLQELSPLDVALPETITRTQAIEKGHVNRLYAQEKTLQSVLYQNQNGTKTAYVFDKPVKYVRDGEVLDKDTTIRATGIAGYAYAMTENSFSAYFGSTAANGVMIQYEDYAFSMKPETSMLVSTPTLGEDAKTVIYNGAFGAQTALRYETQLSGVKEDIILMRNVGKYAFNFLLTTSGLTPVQKENGAWTLVNADQETVIDFGSIVIKDSAGKTVYGTLNITPRASGGYIMTVTVPQAFLQAANTVYPVYVDPTTLIQETEQFIEYEGSEAFITDYTAIYDTSMIPLIGSFDYIEDRHVLHSEAYARFIFSDFILSYGQFSELTPSQITKATLHTTPLSCFEAYIYTAPIVVSNGNYGYYNWTVPDFEYIYEYEVASSHWASSLARAHHVWVCGEEDCTTGHCAMRTGEVVLDFTSTALSWARYNNGSTSSDYNPANGLAVYSDNANYTYLDYIASVEASGNSSVYYEIDYDTSQNTYYIKNSSYHDVLKKEQRYDPVMGYREIFECKPGSITGIDNEWQIIPDGTGYYHISFLDGNVKKYLGNMTDGYYIAGYGYVEDQHFMLDDVAHDWIITEVSSGQYTFKHRYGGYLYQSGSSFGMQTSLPASTAANYESFLWELANSTTYAPLESFSIQVNSLDYNGSTSPTIIPSPTNATWVRGHHFEWTSSDTSIITVDENGCLTGVDYGTATISATHIFTGVESEVTVIVGEEVGYGYVNTLKNISTGELLIPENNNTNSTIKVEAYGDTKTAMMWKIEYTSNGYFKIQNDVTGYYLRAPANNTNGAQITQGAYSDTYGLWRFIKSSDGYKIISKNQHTRSASSPLYLAVSNGTVVQSSTLTTNFWDIQTLTMNLNVYYDQAFEERYERLNLTPQECIRKVFFEDLRSDWEKIKYADCEHRTIIQFFKEEFGIKVNVNIQNEVQDSYPYIADPPCEHKDDPSANCRNCLGVSIPSYNNAENSNALYCKDGYHHKSAEWFINSTPTTEATISIMFTGHKPTCNYHYDNQIGMYVHEDDRVNGNGYTSSNRCVIFACAGDIGLMDELIEVKQTVAHEILHLFYVDHHDYMNLEQCIHAVNADGFGSSYTDTEDGEDSEGVERVENAELAYDRIYITLCSPCRAIVNEFKLNVLYTHSATS